MNMKNVMMVQLTTDRWTILSNFPKLRRKLEEMSKEKEIQRHGNNAVNINHPKRKNAAQGCEEKYKKLGEAQA